jgi:hypothetical protein
VEHGELGVRERPSTIFVFEGLIAQLEHKRRERTALRLHQWELALDQWVFDLQVRSHMQMLMERYGIPLQVLTWRPIGFADALHDRLWYYNIPVSFTKSSIYQMSSQEIATDPGITHVYDADPAHRFGYGFKVREFHAGQV